MSCPLFDTTKWIRNLERVYLRMWEIHCEGNGPRTFEIEWDYCTGIACILKMCVCMVMTTALSTLLFRCRVSVLCLSVQRALGMSQIGIYEYLVVCNSNPELAWWSKALCLWHVEYVRMGLILSLLHAWFHIMPIIYSDKCVNNNQAVCTMHLHSKCVHNFAHQGGKNMLLFKHVWTGTWNRLDIMWTFEVKARANRFRITNVSDCRAGVTYLDVANLQVQYRLPSENFSRGKKSAIVNKQVSRRNAPNFTNKFHHQSYD